MFKAPKDQSGSKSETADCLLLTRRIDDPTATVEGFDEVYYCPTCGDYFGLAWHATSSPLAQICDAVEPEGRTRIFCPVCGRDYEMYGPILGKGAPVVPLEEVTVFGSCDFPFPVNLPTGRPGLIKVGEFVIEKIVLLVTGELPPDGGARDLAYSVVHQEIDSLGGEFAVSEGGGIRIHMLRTDAVSDDSDWVLQVLQQHIYEPDDWATRPFFTKGPFALRPPWGQLLICLVTPPIGPHPDTGN